jgi:hypothetical protein
MQRDALLAAVIAQHDVPCLRLSPAFSCSWPRADRVPNMGTAPQQRTPRTPARASILAFSASPPGRPPGPGDHPRQKKSSYAGVFEARIRSQRQGLYGQPFRLEHLDG